MPYATVNGNSLYYELHGASGEELVLVHGFSGDISDWQHQVPEFSGTHRVLVLDQRGHGRSLVGAGATWVSSACVGCRRRPCFPYSAPARRPGRPPRPCGRSLAKGAACRRPARRAASSSFSRCSLRRFQ